jgi:hypothetical protein
MPDPEDKHFFFCNTLPFITPGALWQVPVFRYDWCRGSKVKVNYFVDKYQSRLAKQGKDQQDWIIPYDFLHKPSPAPVRKYVAKRRLGSLLYFKLLTKALWFQTRTVRSGVGHNHAYTCLISQPKNRK